MARRSLQNLSSLPVLLAVVVFAVFTLHDRSASGSILEFIPAIIAGSKFSPPPPVKDHSSITEWKGTATCLACHTKEAKDVFSSVHYQWRGNAKYMTAGPQQQGKLDTAVNSYCINTTGNWSGCSSCHIGLGKKPVQQESQDQLNNIDCMICHQDLYKRKRLNDTFVPDTENMSISMLDAARNVHKPTRFSCLQCHAKGGGGDNYKRGDMALAHATTSDRDFDVHMATTGADLNCQSCHTTENHLMAGKGSDLRPTELDVEMQCTQCHKGKDTLTGHENRSIGYHVTRVACQTCHISYYARDAADTASTENTEVHRSWLNPHLTSSGAIHPQPVMAGDLLPRYRWWNGTSKNYNLYDQASVDSNTGRIPTSRPVGHIDDTASKLFPFKYKTALQPFSQARNTLLALDTSVYFSTGDPDMATRSGLVNMGYASTETYEWKETDTYQLITHEIQPSSSALDCIDCHDSTARMDLQGELGYQLKGQEMVVCTECHRYEQAEEPGYKWIHEEHVKEEQYDCSWCHTFSRPERNLR